MNVNFEYYKIFYYVAKYGSLRRLPGHWEARSQM